jgi:hypothetical protein
MSQLLQGLADADGRIPATDSVAAPTNYRSGLPFDSGKLAVTLNGVVNNYHQGLPFTATGRLAVEQGVFSYYGSGAAPFTASGRLLISVNVPDYYLAGVGYDEITKGVCLNTSGVLFSPSELFKNGEKGAWYDPSDLTTMFQDSAGTTPVTADGQPVGLIRDKSGNNNHASQPVANKRPTYRQAGAERWLDFDGVDDSLFTASINLSTTSKVTVFSGTANFKTTGTGTLIEFSPNYLNNAGSFAALTPSLTSSNISFGSRGTSAAGEKETPSAPIGAGAKRVLTCAQDFATAFDYGCDYIRFNQIPLGNLIGAGNTDVGAGPFGNFPAYIGARNNGSNGAGGNSLQGRIYSLIFAGQMYSTGVLVATEEWIDAQMQGVTVTAPSLSVSSEKESWWTSIKKYVGKHDYIFVAQTT